MMYRLKTKHRVLCVLSIDPLILDGDSVIITDGNAASLRQVAICHL